MPCWTIKQTTVGKMDTGLLKKALLAKGENVYENENGDITWYRGQYVKATATLTVAGGVSETNAVKRAYSAQVIQKTVSAFGWKAKDLGNNKFSVQKRSF